MANRIPSYSELKEDVKSLKKIYDATPILKEKAEQGYNYTKEKVSEGYAYTKKKTNDVIEYFTGEPEKEKSEKPKNN